MLPHFRQNRNGLIINISSMGGKITLPMMSLYHATKFAVEGFSESLFHELYALNIHIKLIEPGGVDTNFGTTSLEVIPNQLRDYEPFIENFSSRFQQFRTERDAATVEEVAQTIYEAATDGKERLRYVIGNDGKNFIGHLNPQNDDAYIAHMKAFWQTQKTI